MSGSHPGGPVRLRAVRLQWVNARLKTRLTIAARLNRVALLAPAREVAMKKTRPAAIRSCLVALCLASPWAATEARAERVLYASANGQAGYIDGRRIEAPSLETVLAKIYGRLGERTVIQLLGDDPTDAKVAVFHIQKYPCLYLIARVEGAPGSPLVIRGLKRRGRWLTLIAADSVDDI